MVARSEQVEERSRGKVEEPGHPLKAILRVLVVEDSLFDAELLLGLLRRGGYEPLWHRVETAEEFRAALKSQTWDIVLADYNLPQFSAPDALALLQESGLDLPFIVVSGGIGESTAVEAMKAGAHDYLMKDNLARLIPAVGRELREAANRASRRKAKEALLQSERELAKNKEQFRVAREIQQHLFPKAAPDIPGFEIAGASCPAEATGGDYFDYLPMLNGSLGIVVGDVAGHGVGPALLMAEARAYLRILTKNQPEVSEILTQANAILTEDIGGDRFISMLLAHIDPVTRTLTYTNAGHPAGYVVDIAGEIRTTLKRTGIPLGMRSDVIYPKVPSVALESGDLVVLLTDGFEEALGLDDDWFGVERILEVIRENRQLSAQRIVDALFERLRQFTGDTPQEDDLTVIIVKVG